MKKKIKYIIIPIIMIILFITITIISNNIIKNNSYMILKPSQSTEMKKYISIDDLNNSEYSIKFIVKDINNEYKIYYITDGSLKMTDSKSIDNRESVYSEFYKTAIKGEKIFTNIEVTSAIILLISTLYILIGKYEKINSKIKNILYIVFTFLLYMIAFIYIPMISKNHGNKLYLYLMISIMFITSFIWGYKRKSIFRYSLLSIIPFWLGTLFNYSNAYLGNARIDSLNNLLSISQISNTLSFITTLFAYMFIEISGGIVGRFVKNKKIEKLNIITVTIFTLGFVILLLLRIFMNNTISIIADNAIDKMFLGIVVSIIIMSMKLIYEYYKKIKNNKEKN